MNDQLNTSAIVVLAANEFNPQWKKEAQANCEFGFRMNNDWKQMKQTKRERMNWNGMKWNGAGAGLGGK